MLQRIIVSIDKSTEAQISESYEFINNEDEKNVLVLASILYAQVIRNCVLDK